MWHVYDVLVIGAGPGGYVAAIRGAQLGLKVAVAESGFVGGVCLNVGCIPTKALLSATAALSASDKWKRAGVNVLATYDLDTLRAWKERVVRTVTGGVERLFEANGVTLLKGRAVLRRGKVEVEGVGAIDYGSLVLATGSQTRRISALPFDGESVLNSDDALALPSVPKRLTVVGGGAIGVEMATVYRRLGSDVTIVEADELLSGVDAEVADALGKRLRALGMTVHLEAMATGFADGVVTVRFESGEETGVETDAVVVAVGRVPSHGGLDMEALGVETGKRGEVLTDDLHRTSAENVYAIGDVTGAPMLAHRASRQGVRVVETLAGAPLTPMSTIPSVVYTSPEYAWVGLTEEEAKSAGEVVVGRSPVASLGRGHTAAEREGFVKVVARREDGLVLGVHVFMPYAQEVISAASAALDAGARLTDWHTIYPHPTFSECLGEAVDDALSRAIHAMPK